MKAAGQNVAVAALFVLSLAVTTLAYAVVRIATTTSMSCDIARAQDLQRAGRERLAIGIWQKRGIPEIGVVWRGMASDDEAAAAACSSH